MIFFVYPIWEMLKEIKGIRIALKGISGVAGGLIVTSAIILMQKSGIALDNALVALLAAGLLLLKKLPAPLIVLVSIALGFMIPL